MSTYTVVSASQKKTDIEGKYGLMQDIELVLRNPAGLEKTVSWYTKATTAVPAPGSSLEGDVENTEYGLKFKKAQQQQHGFKGGGGPRPRDPQERKSIQAQHAQKCATDIVRLGLSGLSAGNEPASVDAISEAVERVTERLFNQIERLSA